LREEETKEKEREASSNGICLEEKEGWTKKGGARRHRARERTREAMEKRFE
jgi:hypothetical protein